MTHHKEPCTTAGSAGPDCRSDSLAAAPPAQAGGRRLGNVKNTNGEQGETSLEDQYNAAQVGEPSASCPRAVYRSVSRSIWERVFAAEWQVTNTGEAAPRTACGWEARGHPALSWYPVSFGHDEGCRPSKGRVRQRGGTAQPAYEDYRGGPSSIFTLTGVRAIGPRENGYRRGQGDHGSELIKSMGRDWILLAGTSPGKSGDSGEAGQPRAA